MRKTISIFISVYLLSTTITVAAENRLSDIKSLQGSQGYFVLDLILEQRVTEITFGSVRSNSRKLTFGPYDKGRYLLLVPFPSGEYTLEKVASPSYDLPFRHFYSGFDRMRFEIKSRRVNYFAQIAVGDVRSEYGFEINVRNRLAQAYGELVNKHGDLLIGHHINYSGNGVDHFYNEFLSVTTRSDNE